MGIPRYYIIWLSVTALAFEAVPAQQADSMRSPRIEQVNVFSPSDLNLGDNLFQAIPSKPVGEEKPVVRTLQPLTRKGKWILKFDPLLIVRGDVPLFLERRLSHMFSLEAAAGVTFQDYFKQVLINDQPLDHKDPNVSNLSGLSGKLALRIYPHGTAPGDFYFSPQVDIKNYRKDVTGIYLNNSGNYERGVLRDQQKYMDLLAVCGTQNTLELDDYVYLDWYIGVGLRIGQEDNVTHNEQNTAVLELKSQRITTPVLRLGVKLGLGI
ncbi:MAG TPA: hypothetical protein VNZ86_11040 [Bacteroidia bacterium]|jgi:hypothetical protein|nr:hypothetical protein [Bacteroidia bacterium]